MYRSRRSCRGCRCLSPCDVYSAEEPEPEDLDAYYDEPDYSDEFAHAEFLEEEAEEHALDLAEYLADPESLHLFLKAA